jgi:hypothetical protein
VLPTITLMIVSFGSRRGQTVTRNDRHIHGCTFRATPRKIERPKTIEKALCLSFSSPRLHNSSQLKVLRPAPADSRNPLHTHDESGRTLYSLAELCNQCHQLQLRNERRWQIATRRNHHSRRQQQETTIGFPTTPHITHMRMILDHPMHVPYRRLMRHIWPL